MSTVLHMGSVLYICLDIAVGVDFQENLFKDTALPTILS